MYYKSMQNFREKQEVNVGYKNLTHCCKVCYAKLLFKFISWF